MFLLFDRVYVKYDFLLDNNVDNLIISPNLASLVWDELELVHSNIGNQMHNVELYEQLFTGFVAPPVTPPENEEDNNEEPLEAIATPYENDLAFFQALLTKGKVNIHVDTVAYDKIFSKFLKIFFPNMTRDTAWKTYNIFRTNSQLLNTTSFIWGVEGYDTRQQEIADAWIPRTRSQFLEVYDATTLDLPDADYNTFRTDAKQKIGIEWMIANRLNGDQTYDVALGEKMYKLMSQRINEEVQFLKSSLFSNLFRDWSQNVLGIANTVNANTDLMDLEDINDKTRWLFDDDDKFSSPDYLSRHPNIQFSTIRSDILAAVTANTTPIEEALTDDMMDFVYNNTVVQNFTSTDITTILDNDRTHLGPSVFECEDRIKVNALFLSYIYKLKNDSDSELGSYNL
jgi:hypothetical protein